MQIKHLIVGELGTNCYLLISENELGIIDPGGNADKILILIGKTKAKPKYIINTHCHPDHILANEKIRKETGAKILIHEAEKDFINFEADRFLKNEEEIKIGVGDSPSILKVLHTPGHTKGSICLLGENVVFTGDTLFKDGHGRTDLPGGSQKDIEESLEKLSKLLKPGATVYPGHGEIFKYRKRY